MNLKDLVYGDPELAQLVGEPAILVESLNAKTVEVVNHSLIGPVGLTKLLAPEIVEAAALSFEAAATGSATMRLQLATFTSYGFDFADPITRSQIDNLVAGGMPFEIGEALKGLGISYISPAENNGLGVVTLEQVNAIIAEKGKEDLQAEVVEIINQLWAEIAENRISSLAEARAFLGGVG